MTVLRHNECMFHESCVEKKSYVTYALNIAVSGAHTLYSLTGHDLDDRQSRSSSSLPMDKVMIDYRQSRRACLDMGSPAGPIVLDLNRHLGNAPLFRSHPSLCKMRKAYRP